MTCLQFGFQLTLSSGSKKKTWGVMNLNIITTQPSAGIIKKRRIKTKFLTKIQIFKNVFVRTVWKLIDIVGEKVRRTYAEQEASKRLSASCSFKRKCLSEAHKTVVHTKTLHVEHRWMAEHLCSDSGWLIALLTTVSPQLLYRKTSLSTQGHNARGND